MEGRSRFHRRGNVGTTFVIGLQTCEAISTQLFGSELSAFGIDDFTCDVANGPLERVRALREEKAASVSIAVDIDRGMIASLGFMGLGPRTRPEQSRFFSMSQAVHGRSDLTIFAMMSYAVTYVNATSSLR